MADERRDEEHAVDPAAPAEVSFPMSGMAQAGVAPSDVALVPRVPGFTILGRLGEGGMGIVWRAVQLSTGRQVAIKTMSLAVLGSHRARSRFEREVEIAARLEHPGIVRLYDSGVHQSLYFFAMELVEGTPIDQYVESRGLSRRHVIELALQVCDAAQYMHEQGIVHRDLKPSNILVDHSGRTKLMDFGLAKLVESSPELSMAGEIAGTLDQMSPEQARGRTAQADARTDVYLLGLLLHRLLLGRSPHDMRGDTLEVLARISRQDVSVKIGGPVDRDLQAILLKAMALDPGQRYFAAGALAQDLRRYLDGLPVEARLPTMTYVLGRHVRRHWAAVTTAALVVLIVLTTGLVAYRRVTDARDSERSLRREADIRRVDAERRTAQAFLAEGDAQWAAERWSLARDKYEEARKVLAQVGDDPERAELALADALVMSPPSLLTLAGHSSAVSAIAVSEDGLLALSGDRGGKVCCWELPLGRLKFSFDLGSEPILCAAISDDGKTALASNARRRVELWNLVEQKRQAAIPVPKVITSAVFLPDGRLAIAGEERYPILWDDREGKRLSGEMPKTQNWIESLAWSQTTGRLIAGDRHGVITVYDPANPASSTMSYSLNNSAVRVLATDGQAKRYALGGEAPQVMIRGIGDTSGDCTPLEHKSHTVALRWVDGLLHVIASDGAYRWVGNHEVRCSMSLADHVTTAAIMRDGQIALVGRRDGTISVHSINPNAESTLLPTNEPTRCLAVSPDGRMVAIGGLPPVDSQGTRSGEGPLRLWDLGSRSRLWPARINRAPVTALCFTSDSSRLIAGMSEGQTHVYDLNDGSRVILQGPRDQVRGLAVCDDGTRLAVAHGTVVVLWDLKTHQKIQSLSTTEVLDHGVGFAADGQTVQAVSYHRGLWTLDFKSGQVARASGPAAHFTGSAIFGSGAVYSPHEDGLIRRWGSPPASMLEGHTGWVTALAQSRAPRGRLISASRDRTVGIWNSSTSSLRHRLRSHGVPLVAVACSDNGRVVLAGDEHLLARVWDLQRPTELSRQTSNAVAAQRQLAQKPDDPWAALALARWFAFRNVWHWALPLYEMAERGGASPDPMEMGIAYRRMDRPADAVAWYRRSIDTAEAPDVRRYRQMCLHSLAEELRPPSSVRK